MRLFYVNTYMSYHKITQPPTPPPRCCPGWVSASRLPPPVDDDDDDGQRVGTYKFDPVTEYMIKHGRKNGKLDMAWDFYAKYTLPK